MPHLLPVRLHHIFPRPHKRHDFRTSFVEHKMCFDFPRLLVRNISYSKRKWARYCHKCARVLMKSIRYSCQILLKLEFSRQIFEKYTNMKFNENPSIVTPVVPCRPTDRWTNRGTKWLSLLSLSAILRKRLKIVLQVSKKTAWNMSFWHVNIKVMSFRYTTTYNFSILLPTFRRNLLFSFSKRTDNFKFNFNEKRRESNTMKTKINYECCKLQSMGHLCYKARFSSYDAAYT
jgi:hypothetical protein